MSVYYFDVRAENALTFDEEGIDFSKLSDVQEEAVKALAEIVHDALHRSHRLPKQHMAIEVRDQFGPVMQVRITFEIERTRSESEDSLG